MIIFVGDRPSKRTSPTTAFLGAACEPRLKSWIKELEADDYKLINRVDPSFDNLVMYASGLGVPFVALGNAASKALAEMQVNHFKLPHPSARNRQINNKALIAEKLHQCKLWLKGRVRE